MIRIFAAFLIVSFVLTVSACTRTVPSGEVREDAYRANNRGVALLEQFRYPEAAEAFRQALQIDDSIAIARLNLSLALLYAQDLQGAGREASAAAGLLPSAPQPPYVLGLVARAENRPADALREFERVRQINPGDVGTTVNIGQIHLEERRYPEAIAVLREAVAAESFNVTAAYNLGLALTRAGQAAEGREVLARAQTLRTLGYAVTFGTGYLEQGRYAEAVASTGAEPDLVDTAVPEVRFSPASIATWGPPPGGAAAASQSPFGRRFAASDLTQPGAQALAAGLGGGVALIDVESDGDHDLFVASPAGQRLFLNDGRAAWSDVTAASRLGAAPADAVPVGAVAGDYDNDGRADLFVLRYGVSSLYHNDGDGRFSETTAKAGVAPYPYLPGAAAFADVDHDGDVDLIVAGLADLAASRPRAADRALAFPDEFAPAPLQLLRNNGNGTFTDTTAAAGLDTVTHAVAIVPTDFDNRRDIDLLVVNAGRPPALFQNLRDGRFRDVAADVGLAAVLGSNTAIRSATAADVNKDDFPDFFFALSSPPGGGVFALSDGRGRFTAAPAPDGVSGALASQLFDYDNDGLVDLLTWASDGPRIFRNLGRRWSDVSSRAFPERAADARGPQAPRGLALGDLNANGTTDIITASGSVAMWRNEGDAARRAQRVQLRGRTSNRLGVGSKVQLRAGSLSARFETSAATPAIAPSDIVFGLGDRPAADSIRVLWPSGTLQAETLPAAPALSAASAPLSVEELDRKPSSCPFLFTWNGERFEFVTDFLGGGEMGYWEGPRRRNVPDPVEYVRIRGDQLRPRDGRFEIRVTNELEEALFVDRLHLVALAHPRDIEVYPNEGMTEPPKPFRLFAVSDERAPRAIDEHGHDVTEQIARVDRRYPDDFALERIRGYAAPHTLTLDLQVLNAPLAPEREDRVLLLTAWTSYAFSSDNLAASQAGLSLSPPSLQIKDAAGRWRTAIEQIGIPVGRPQTIPVDLSGHLRRGEHEVRIVTNMRVYWDRIAVGRAAAAAGPAAATLDPLTAHLRARGFSGEVRPGGAEPASYDYERVTRASPWKVMAGHYTREGDVRELLVASDDMFVIAQPGDDIALQFDAARLPPLPDGWVHTFLLRADGYSKEMDINSATPDLVEPLPFHAMTGYPYPASERYPDTPEHEQYRATYNTRVVVRTVPRIETSRTR